MKSLGPFSFCLLFLCVQKKKHRFLFCSFTQTSTDHSVSLFSSPVFFFLRKERKRKRERNSFFFFHPSQFFFLFIIFVTEPFVTWSLLILTFFLNSSFCFQLSFSPLSLPFGILSSCFHIFLFSFLFLPQPLFTSVLSFFFFFVLSQSSFFFFWFLRFLVSPPFFFSVSSLLFSVVIHDRFFFIVHYSELPRLFSIFFSYYLLLCDITPLFYQHLFLRF